MQINDSLMVQPENNFFVCNLQGKMDVIKQFTERAKELFEDGRILRFKLVMTMALRMAREIAQNIKQFKENPAVDYTMSTMMHDINNMLGTIIGRVELAVAIHADEEKQEAGKARDGLHNEVKENLSCALEAICVSSKILDKDHGDCSANKEDLQAALEAALRVNNPSQTGKEVEIITYFPKEPVFVGMSQKDLMRLFSNLLKNAHHAVAANKDDRTLGVFVDVKGKIVEVHVVDNGLGIAADHHESIFEPGFTTKGDNGSGLGLHSCRSIVRKHGGKIGVQSARGAGATFCVELPMARA